MYIYTHFRLGSICERVFPSQIPITTESSLKITNKHNGDCTLRHGFSSQSSEDYDVRPSARIHFYIFVIWRWDMLNCWQVSQKTRHFNCYNIAMIRLVHLILQEHAWGGILAHRSAPKGLQQKGMEIPTWQSHCWDDHRITVMQWFMIVTVIDVHPGRLTWVP